MRKVSLSLLENDFVASCLESMYTTRFQMLAALRALKMAPALRSIVEYGLSLERIAIQRYNLCRSSCSSSMDRGEMYLDNVRISTSAIGTEF
jgi:hypothetical protein